MQTLYIADLPLGAGDGDGWQQAEQVLDTWAGARLGLDLVPDGTDRYNARIGARGHSTVLAGADGSRLRLWQVRTVAPGRPLWAFDVTAWLTTDYQQGPASTTLRVRLGAHALHGRVAELPDLPGAPGPVTTLLREREVLADGYRLGHPQIVTAEQVPALADFLLDDARRRPVLVLTSAAAPATPGAGAVTGPVDAHRAARTLAGLAHVALVADRAATFALTDALGGSALSVFNSAARLYWPGLRLDARRGDHPLWYADRLRAHGQRFADVLFARLGRISALTLSAPALQARLQNEVRQARRAQQAEDLQALTRQYNEALQEVEQLRVEAAEAAAIDHAEPDDLALFPEPVRPGETSETGEVIGEDWFSEHERVSDELEATANERDELQDRVEQLERDLAAAQDNIKAMAMATSVTEPVAHAEDDLNGDLDRDLGDPASVLAAVEWAASTCPHLEILPEAFDSARASAFPRPRQVLDDLAAMEKVASAWSREDLPGGVEPAFVAAGCSGYRSGISSTARTRYPEDYERRWQDRTITLGPHVARGTGAPNTIMRIYWHPDPDARVFVVGHVGAKLRDESNP